MLYNFGGVTSYVTRGTLHNKPVEVFSDVLIAEKIVCEDTTIQLYKYLDSITIWKIDNKEVKSYQLGATIDPGIDLSDDTSIGVTSTYTDMGFILGDYRCALEGVSVTVIKPVSEDCYEVTFVGKMTYLRVIKKICQFAIKVEGNELSLLM